jgi:hypothetical protein
MNWDFLIFGEKPTSIVKEVVKLALVVVFFGFLCVVALSDQGREAPGWVRPLPFLMLACVIVVQGAHILRPAPKPSRAVPLRPATAVHIPPHTISSRIRRAAQRLRR